MVLDEEEGLASSRPAVGRVRCGIAGALSLLLVATAMAQEIATPVGIQVQLLLKVLPFDRNLKGRVGSEMVIGVVYQKEDQASSRVMRDFIAEIDKSGSGSDGIRIRCIPLPIEERKLDAISGAKSVNALYVTPMHGIRISEIRAISRSRRLLTITGVPQFVEQGLAIGLGAGGGREMILINLPSAISEGADISSELLNLARVIR